MTQTVHGYAARDTGGHLSPFSFERRDLREDDVQIDILYCGVCHSDLHQATIGAGAITRWYPAMKSSAVCAKWAPKSVNSKQAI